MIHLRAMETRAFCFLRCGTVVASGAGFRPHAVRGGWRILRLLPRSPNWQEPAR
jgi:hypothetical protein